MSAPENTQRVAGAYGATYTELPGMGLHALGPNAVLTISGEGWSAEAAAALKGALRPDVLLLVLNEGDSLAVLDEDAMRDNGWVRA